MLYGLWRKRCQSEVTRTALWLLQTEQVEAAEELLGNGSRMALTNGVQVLVTHTHTHTHTHAAGELTYFGQAARHAFVALSSRSELCLVVCMIVCRRVPFCVSGGARRGVPVGRAVGSRQQGAVPLGHAGRVRAQH